MKIFSKLRHLIPSLPHEGRKWVAASLCLSALTAAAVELPAGTKTDSFVEVDLINIERTDNDLVTTLSFDFSKVDLKGNTEIIICPLYYNGTDTVRLETVTVAGRNRWYWLQRNNMEPELLVKGYGKEPRSVPVGSETVIDIRMKQLLLQYAVVGGMPEVVQTFVNTRRMDEVLHMQRDIIR